MDSNALVFKSPAFCWAAESNLLNPKGIADYEQGLACHPEQ